MRAWFAAPAAGRAVSSALQGVLSFFGPTQIAKSAFDGLNLISFKSTLAHNPLVRRLPVVGAAIQFAEAGIYLHQAIGNARKRCFSDCKRCLAQAALQAAAGLVNLWATSSLAAIGASIATGLACDIACNKIENGSVQALTRSGLKRGIADIHDGNLPQSALVLPNKRDKEFYAIHARDICSAQILDWTRERLPGRPSLGGLCPQVKMLCRTRADGLSRCRYVAR